MGSVKQRLGWRNLSLCLRGTLLLALVLIETGCRSAQENAKVEPFRLPPRLEEEGWTAALFQGLDAGSVIDATPGDANVSVLGHVDTVMGDEVRRISSTAPSISSGNEWVSSAGVVLDMFGLGAIAEARGIRSVRVRLVDPSVVSIYPAEVLQWIRQHPDKQCVTLDYVLSPIASIWLVHSIIKATVEFRFVDSSGAYLGISPDEFEHVSGDAQLRYSRKSDGSIQSLDATTVAYKAIKFRMFRFFAPSENEIEDSGTLDYANLTGEVGEGFDYVYLLIMKPGEQHWKFATAATITADGIWMATLVLEKTKYQPELFTVMGIASGKPLSFDPNTPLAPSDLPRDNDLTSAIIQITRK
jgi:hypothetical protein